MLPLIATYFGILLVFSGLDAAWLSLMGPRLYKPLLQDVLTSSVRPSPALLFYALYAFGILFLAVAPWASPTRFPGVFLRGALLGLVAYATYDLTNQATLRTWPVIITLADLAWGTVVTALAASAGFAVWQWFSGRAF